MKQQLTESIQQDEVPFFINQFKAIYASRLRIQLSTDSKVQNSASVEEMLKLNLKLRNQSQAVSNDSNKPQALYSSRKNAVLSSRSNQSQLQSEVVSAYQLGEKSNPEKQRPELKSISVYEAKHPRFQPQVRKRYPENATTTSVLPQNILNTRLTTIKHSERTPSPEENPKLAQTQQYGEKHPVSAYLPKRQFQQPIHIQNKKSQSQLCSVEKPKTLGSVLKKSRKNLLSQDITPQEPLPNIKTSLRMYHTSQVKNQKRNAVSPQQHTRLNMYLLHPKVKLLEIPKKVGEDYMAQLMSQPDRAQKSASRIRMSQAGVRKNEKNDKSEIMKSQYKKGMMSDKPIFRKFDPLQPADQRQSKFEFVKTAIPDKSQSISPVRPLSQASFTHQAKASLQQFNSQSIQRNPGVGLLRQSLGGEGKATDEIFLSLRSLSRQKDLNTMERCKEKEIIRIRLSKQELRKVEPDAEVAKITDGIVVSFNSRDGWLRRAALRKGWVENVSMTSQLWTVKWEFSDQPDTYKSLKPNQFYNHFADSRELTTKQGLNSILNSITQPGIDIFKFYPRCYDLSDGKQADSFKEDFTRTAVLSCLKIHAKYFLKQCRSELSSISEAYSDVNQIKKHYDSKFSPKIVAVNTVLLINCIFFAQNVLLQDQSCEGDEFIKHSFYKPTYKFQEKIIQQICEYSKFRPPFLDTKLPNKLWQIRGWELPSLHLMSVTSKMHRLLKQKVPQYKQIDGDFNIWISKPSYNSRGVGVFCFDQLKEAFPGGVNKRAMCPKIVQKYIERPFLINKRKFDIRQWVFVNSFDPLEVMVYNKAYLRICAKDFDISNHQDPQRHISNFSINQDDELVMSSEDFITYVRSTYPGQQKISWETFFLPQIVKIVRDVLGQSAEQIQTRTQSFELFGFDFAIDKNLQLWLVEINMSPACAERQPWLSAMLDDMANGLISVISAKVNGQADVCSQAGVTGWVTMQCDDFFMINVGGEPTKVKLKDQKQFETQIHNLELVGTKVNTKVENFIDKLCQREASALFIQKHFRGFLIRNRVSLKTLRSEKNKKQSSKKIFEVIQQALGGNLLKSAFIKILKTSWIKKHIKNLTQIKKIQAAVRRAIQKQKIDLQIDGKYKNLDPDFLLDLNAVGVERVIPLIEVQNRRLMELYNCRGSFLQEPQRNSLDHQLKPQKKLLDQLRQHLQKPTKTNARGIKRIVF